MKLLFISLFLLGFMSATAQSQSPANEVASKISYKMKDSLALTEQQRNQIFDINMQIHIGKMTKRQQYAGSDSLRLQVQWVENTRDSLYRSILGEEKYFLYRQKKTNLVTSN